MTLEDVAKIIDPDAFHKGLPTDGCEPYWSGRRAAAIMKAKQISDGFRSMLPDHIDIYRTIKRSKARRHGDIAKAVAAALAS